MDGEDRIAISALGVLDRSGSRWRRFAASPRGTHGAPAAMEISACWSWSTLPNGNTGRPARQRGGARHSAQVSDRGRPRALVSSPWARRRPHTSPASAGTFPAIRSTTTGSRRGSAATIRSPSASAAVSSRPTASGSGTTRSTSTASRPSSTRSSPSRRFSAALDDRGIDAADLRMLACATTMGDVLVPGFASMVHGRLGGGPMQLLSASGVCASSLAALDAAVSKIRLGDHPRAAVVGSELASRSLRQRRFDGIRAGMDSHFLRWMLSDGAGAVVVEFQPHPSRPSLRVDWVRQVSLAHEHDVCMRAGMSGAEPSVGRTWQDVDIADAEAAGMFVLRQDVSMLDELAEAGLRAVRGTRRHRARRRRRSSTTWSATTAPTSSATWRSTGCAAASRPSTPTGGSRTSRPAATPGRRASSSPSRRPGARAVSPRARRCCSRCPSRDDSRSPSPTSPWSPHPNQQGAPT